MLHDGPPAWSSVVSESGALARKKQALVSSSRQLLRRAFFNFRVFGVASKQLTQTRQLSLLPDIVRSAILYGPMGWLRSSKTAALALAISAVLTAVYALIYWAAGGLL
jgi:hypothetical protein